MPYPFLIEYRGLPKHEQPQRDSHEYLSDLRDFLSWRKAEAILLAEANIPMDQVDGISAHPATARTSSSTSCSTSMSS